MQDTGGSVYHRAVGVLGSHGYAHPAAVRACVAALAETPGVRVVTRGRGSVDRMALAEAARRQLDVAVITAPRRDYQIVALVSELHVFWDGRSPGTRHVIALARAAGVPVRVHGLVA